MVAKRLVWFLSGEFKLYALGLFLVVFGLFELAREELSLRVWKSVQGTIVDSRTEWLEKKNNLGPQLTVKVRYRYPVEGRDYESTRLTTGEPVLFYGVQEAAEFRKRFPPGARVTVFYAPSDPSQATLIAARSSGPWILLGFGVPCLLAAFVQWRRRRRREEAEPSVEIPLDWV
jgi:hypothetical protein